MFLSMVHRTKEECISICLEAIEKDPDITNISELCISLPFSSAHFYDLELQKVESIKKAIDANKVKLKKGLKKNWKDSTNPTLQLAVFKLNATDEELKALSMAHADITSNGNSINVPIISWIGNDDKGED